MSASSREDCHFYYYVMGGCSKGTGCNFRHEPASKGNENRCKAWLKNKKCDRPACCFRHKALDKVRALEDCFHERNGGCAKGDCPFKHSKPRLLKGTGANTVPISKSAKETISPFTCQLCDVSPPNAAAYALHVQGQKHKKKLENVSSTQINLTVKGAGGNKTSCPGPPPLADKSGLVCKLCDFRADNKYYYDEHMNSQGHREQADRGRTPKRSKAKQRPKSVAKKSVPLPIDLSLPPPGPLQALANIPRHGSNVSLPNHLNRQISNTPGEDLKVGVFWDLENCSLPKGKSPAAFVNKLKEQFGCNKILETMVVACDVAKNRNVAKVLQEMKVDVFPVVMDAKNTADDLLKSKMRDFAEHPQCRIVLITGDVDFSHDLLFYRERKGHEVLLMHNNQAKETLKTSATQAIRFTDFVKHIPFGEPPPPIAKSASTSSVNGSNPKQTKKSLKGVMFLWDMKSLPCPDEIQAGEIVSKARSEFLIVGETQEIAFSACRSLVQVCIVDHIREMNVEMSLDSPLDVLTKNLRTKTPDIVIILSNDPILNMPISELRTQKKVDVLLFKGVNCPVSLMCTVGQGNCLDFEAFCQPLLPKVELPTSLTSKFFKKIYSK